jgi:hypothetical protein
MNGTPSHELLRNSILGAPQAGLTPSIIYPHSWDSGLPEMSFVLWQDFVLFFKNSSAEEDEIRHA